jgi:hypothetical protein
VETGLLVHNVNESTLLTLIGVKSCGQVKLETIGDLVLELDDGSEHVVGVPSLGEGDTILGIGILGLEVTMGSVRLGVARSVDGESYSRRSARLDFE